MGKMIKFSISEASGRSFELDFDTLKEKYEELGNEFEDDTDVAEMVRGILGDDLCNLDEYEKNNSYFEWNIEEITEV